MYSNVGQNLKPSIKLRRVCTGLALGTCLEARRKESACLPQLFSTADQIFCAGKDFLLIKQPGAEDISLRTSFFPLWVSVKAPWTWVPIRGKRGTTIFLGAAPFTQLSCWTWNALAKLLQKSTPIFHAYTSPFMHSWPWKGRLAWSEWLTVELCFLPMGTYVLSLPVVLIPEIFSVSISKS